MIQIVVVLEAKHSKMGLPMVPNGMFHNAGLKMEEMFFLKFFLHFARTFSVALFEEKNDVSL